MTNNNVVHNNNAKQPERRYSRGVTHGWILWSMRKLLRLKEDSRQRGFAELAIPQEP